MDTNELPTLENRRLVSSDLLGSFDFWKSKGRRIHRGQKATEIKDGVPIFHLSQTYQPQQMNWGFSRALGGVSYAGDDMPH